MLLRIDDVVSGFKKPVEKKKGASVTNDAP